MKYKFTELIDHLKVHGFFFQNSEIYGGLSNSWDYGPLGIEIKNKLKSIWWKYFITNFEFNYGIDSNIFMNSNVWHSSGHINNFSDPLIDCKNCKYRFRPDKIIEQKINKNISHLNNQELSKLIIKIKIKCPKCNKSDFTNIRKFQLMFEVNNSITDDKQNNSNIFLRPETAQGIFLNFKNVQRSMSAKLPFGIGQIGKSFRNEITPGNFIFRTREFEQMELEFFYSKYDKTNWFDFWIQKINDFLINIIGIDNKKITIEKHSKEKLAHYSKKTVDFNYNFPFGTGELWGIADRGTYDLESHSKYSKKDLSYFDIEKKEKYFPMVIEPSVGVDRLLLSILCDAFSKETKNNKERIILKLNNKLAPFNIYIFPLVKNEKLITGATKILNELTKHFEIKLNANGNIGKRYFKADAIGIPFCITYDYDSINDNSVTIRFRDTAKQIRIKIEKLKNFFAIQFNN